MNVRDSPNGNIKDGTITWQGSDSGLYAENTTLKKTNEWYEHAPQGMIESDKVKLLWDFTIQCDHQIEHRRPDMVVVEKTERKCIIIDIAIPGDNRVGEK